jgi:hypothetical protein
MNATRTHTMSLVSRYLLRRLRPLFVLPFAITACQVALAQPSPAPLRPPAVPLITHNPYFSIWSDADRLTDDPPRHWTGVEQPFTGMIRIDGHPYRFMNRWPQQIPAMRQTSLELTPTRTRYQFEAEGIALSFTFLSPLIASDLELVSRPVTYLTWDAHSTDGRSHDVSLFLDADPRIAVNSGDQQVVWGRTHLKGLTVLNVGSRDQQPVNRSGDNLRIDWGYFHLVVPDAAQAQTSEAFEAIDTFAKSGTLPSSDDMDMPLSPDARGAHLAVVLPMGQVGASVVSRHVLVSYTQGPAIEYLGRRLKEYWQRNNQPVDDMLEQSEREYAELETRSGKFDQDLTADLKRAGGDQYAQLAVLAYRQTLAAHGLVADIDGTPMMFPKENFSNGCIATVDILYPTSPFFLLLSPRLMEAQLKPVLEYAALPRWKWPFAPHDLGQYPLANGQVYGGGERTEEDQMPVEESGNLLIITAALGQAEGDWHLAKEYWPLLTKWADYLLEKGMDPENQLSTDDFAGHLAHNANLSIKAIDGLGAYAKMARALGKKDVADEYSAKAKAMAIKFESLGKDGDHYNLAFDKPGTWSQKYNLVWDDLLDLKLFDAKIKKTELAYYHTKLNRYALPLDSRKTYTKLDWQIWTATMADSKQQFEAFMAPIATWVNETPTRVPLTDWYDTIDGKQVGFQARSVVGGVYIKALADREISAKWQHIAMNVQ